MVYLTVRQSPAYHQITLEEVLFPTNDTVKPWVNYNISNTKTYALQQVSAETLNKIDVNTLVLRLCSFNAATAELRKVDRKDLYRFYKIPKRSGGLRKISVPEPRLMSALRELKDILELDFGALYHTSAFAYIEKRSTVAALKRHQANCSHWFAKFDLHDFFGSTTLDFAMQQLEMIFPFSEVCKNQTGRAALREAIELGFLDNGLPQGTPLSPTLTNILMIPIDYKLTKAFRNFDGPTLVYTRYADDFLVSSQKNFRWSDVQKIILDTLKEFNAPFSLNKDKTRYGSNTGGGANWNLGLMLNAENKITIGHKRKDTLRCALTNYLNDKKSGVRWDVGDIQHIIGQYSYYHMVEPEAIDKIVDTLQKKTGMNAIDEMRKEISA